MKKILIGLATVSALVLMPELLAAATDKDLTARIGSWTDTFNSVGGFFKIIVGFAGAIFAFMGIVGLKKYADDARQNPLMKPLIMFIAGALALGFVAFTTTLAQTAVEENDEGSILNGSATAQ